MNEWVNEWVNEQMNELTNERMNQWTNEPMNEGTNERIPRVPWLAAEFGKCMITSVEQMNEGNWMNECMNEWMNEWIPRAPWLAAEFGKCMITSAEWIITQSPESSRTYTAFHILPQIYTANHASSQYRWTQLQYRFAVISEAPSKKDNSLMGLFIKNTDCKLSKILSQAV